MRFFSPDTSFYSGYADKGKFLLIWRLCVLFSCTFSILSAVFYFIQPVSFIFYLIISIIAIIGFCYLGKTRKYQPLFWVFTISATIVNSISFVVIVETVHYSEFFWVVAIIIFAFIGLGRRIGLIFLVANTIPIIVHMLVSLNPGIRILRPHTPVESLGILTELLFALFMIGYLLHQYLLFQSYAENQLKLANAELGIQNQLVLKKNEENSLLAKEIHHRVKNNLQIIISLLRMQSYEVKSEETKQHFSEAMNRIMAMSLIHQKLYQEKELSNIDVKSYLEELIHEILASFSSDKTHISCDIKSKIERVGLKTIVPLGLLLNELITNSVKHAFAGKETGTISIDFTETQERRILLNYSDNGDWNAAAETYEGFGIELIGLLTSQLEGSYSRKESTYRFELGNLDH